MNLVSLYEAVDEILSQLDFGQLYPCFKKYPFALYDRMQICIDRKIISYDERFLANTSIFYEGKYTAIWNVEPQQENILDVKLLAYSIVHEMFHCFQEENHENRFPNDLKLLNYPSDLENYQYKYLEDRYLASAFSHGDRECLIRFSEIRNFRLANYGAVLQEELKAETTEGVAEYVGLKALKAIDEAKYQEIILNYLDKLENDLSLLFDVRKISYYTGTIFCLTLEKLGLPVHNDFQELSVYQQNMPSTASCRGDRDNANYFSEISCQFHQLSEHRKHIISSYMTDKYFIEYPAVICGYDPMNMFRSGNMIYCSHFIFLQNRTETIKIDGPILLLLKKDSDNEITGYYLRSSSSG